MDVIFRVGALEPQLSHTEPAIKHGILALSTLHEQFENSVPTACSETPAQFAMLQIVQAVKHSNILMKLDETGKVDLEKVITACIIFTCYKNLAGNYASANMHLRNGLNILKQDRRDGLVRPNYEPIGHVLYRFDLQAMTFSDDSSPYTYDMANAPQCPPTPARYPNNAAARDDLVRLLQCMLWISGMADNDSNAPQHPVWLEVYSQLMRALEEWEVNFAWYLKNMPLHEQENAKVQDGNTLLQMYMIITRIIAASGAGLKTELAWDDFVDNFESVVDLAETLPILQPRTPPLSESTTPGPRPHLERPLASVPIRIPSISDLGTTTLRFESTNSPNVDHAWLEDELAEATKTKRTPIAFSPSFELSPLVPLFLTIT